MPKTFGYGAQFHPALSGDFYRLSRFQRLCGLVSQQLGPEPILERWTRCRALGNRFGKSIQSLIVAPLHAFEPACMKAVLDDFVSHISRDSASSLAPRLDHPLRAKDFNAPSTPILGTPGGISLAKRPRYHPN